MIGTAAVLAIMAGLAWPLHHLTKPAGRAPDAAPALAPASQAVIPALVRVKLLAAAVSVVVTDAEGAVLLALENPAAGESEHDAELPLTAEGRCEVRVAVDFGSGGVETALFLTLMPDGLEPATRFLTGSGRVTEEFRFQWPPWSSSP